jgi:hypothetical protein
VPRLLSYIVAVYLIVIGILGLVAGRSFLAARSRKIVSI